MISIFIFTYCFLKNYLFQGWHFLQIKKADYRIRFNKTNLKDAWHLVWLIDIFFFFCKPTPKFLFAFFSGIFLSRDAGLFPTQEDNSWLLDIKRHDYWIIWWEYAQFCKKTSNHLPRRLLILCYYHSEEELLCVHKSGGSISPSNW